MPCLGSIALSWLNTVQNLWITATKNPLLSFVFQFQEMLKQYEENLHNERIEKTRFSEDYESKIQVLTLVRNQINFQPTIFSRAFLTQVSVMNLTTASPSSEKFTLSLNAVANAPCLLFPVLFLWSVTKNTEMHAGRTRPLRFCSLSF